MLVFGDADRVADRMFAKVWSWIGVWMSWEWGERWRRNEV
jgi:hypothetical protein